MWQTPKTCRFWSGSFRNGVDEPRLSGDLIPGRGDSGQEVIIVFTKNKRTRASSKNLSSVPSITPGACSVFMDSDKAHEAGLPVYAFTLNHTDDFEKALEWGIDGIFTD